MSDNPVLYESRDGRLWQTQQEAQIQERIITLNEKLHGIASDREVAQKLAAEQVEKDAKENDDSDVLLG